jgi:selenide,water dikinase
VLTKPLGIGILTTGIKQGKTSPEAAGEVVDVMERLNRDASEAMVEVGVHAATDVSGFGLLGHLYEMTSASAVRATVWFDRIPVLEEARTLVDRGAIAGGTARNYEYLAARVDYGPLSPGEQLILADAQTSGGLLLVVPGERLEALRSALRRRGVDDAHVGEITGSGDGRIEVIG